MMNNGFTKGLVIGGIIGASVSAMMNKDMLSGRNRRKLMRNGRNILKKSSDLIGDVVDIFR